MTGPVRVSGRRVDGPSDAADTAPSRDFAPAVQSRDLGTVAAGSVPDPNLGVLSCGRRDALGGGSIRLLSPPSGVLRDPSCRALTGSSRRGAQTYEEVCDSVCYVGPGAYDGFTVQVYRDSVSVSGEGACRDASIDVVFLGCKGTEACYYAGDGGRKIGVVVRRRARVRPGGRFWQGYGWCFGDGALL